MKNIARAVAAMSSAVMLISCAFGPDYGKASASLPDVAPDKGRIVFFRKWHFQSSVICARIKIDGQRVGCLSNAAVMQIDHSPGDVKIALDRPEAPGECIVPLKVDGGRTYYIEVDGNGGHGGGEAFGAVGLLLSSLKPDADQYCGGPWCAAIRDKADALPKLQDLTLETADAS